MRARHNQLREKYRTFRLLPDPLYQSRLLQTFFNKFTRKGQKAFAHRRLFSALRSVRHGLAYPGLYLALLRIFRRLHISLVIMPRRKGKQILSVPVPVRRNKRDTLNLQFAYNGVTGRRERMFEERLEQELTELSFGRAATSRAYAAHYAGVYEQRVNMEYR